MKDLDEYLIAEGIALFVDNPDDIETLRPPYDADTLKEILKHKSHVADLINSSRTEYFREIGVSAVPRRITGEAINNDINVTTRHWLSLRDRHGKADADNKIKEFSRFNAHEDAKSAGVRNTGTKATREEVMDALTQATEYVKKLIEKKRRADLASAGIDLNQVLFVDSEVFRFLCEAAVLWSRVLGQGGTKEQADAVVLQKAYDSGLLDIGEILKMLH